jgi:hypothetical protein
VAGSGLPSSSSSLVVNFKHKRKSDRVYISRGDANCFPANVHVSNSEVPDEVLLLLLLLWCECCCCCPPVALGTVVEDEFLTGWSAIVDDDVPGGASDECFDEVCVAAAKGLIPTPEPPPPPLLLLLEIESIRVLFVLLLLLVLLLAAAAAAAAAELAAVAPVSMFIMMEAERECSLGRKERKKERRKEGTMAFPFETHKRNERFDCCWDFHFLAKCLFYGHNTKATPTSIMFTLSIGEKGKCNVRNDPNNCLPSEKSDK